MSWQENAPCRRRGSTFVFNTDERHTYGARAANIRARIDQATALCAECPGRQECLDAELDWMRASKISTYGVYGGTSQAERRWLLELDPDLLVIAERRLWTLADSMRMRSAA